MQSNHDTATPATPQGDGADRPYPEYLEHLHSCPECQAAQFPCKEAALLGLTGRPFRTSDLTGPVRVHLEKSGPAFPFKRGSQFLPLTTAEMLGASLVAQTGTAIGQVLNAIQRKCLLDLMPAWTRLLKIYGITVNGQSRTALRRDWFWGEAFDAIVAALCYSETEQGQVKWLVADMVLRGEAAVAAEHASRSLREYEASPDGQENAEMLRRNIAAYRAFAEGRA